MIQFLCLELFFLAEGLRVLLSQHTFPVIRFYHWKTNTFDERVCCEMISSKYMMTRPLLQATQQLGSRGSVKSCKN